jgi:hypothetical protein
MCGGPILWELSQLPFGNSENGYTSSARQVPCSLEEQEGYRICERAKSSARHGAADVVRGEEIGELIGLIRREFL